MLRAASRAWVTLPLGLALGAYSCGKGPPPAPVSDTLTLAVRADVTGFFPNPPIESEAFTIDVNRGVFETLVRFDQAFHLEPALAERWENPDDRTYVFDIRPGVRFSDGRPLTAHDVAASLNAIRERGWVLSEYLGAIESVTASDDRRVRIRTRYPSVALLPKLTWAFVLPADAVAKTPVPAVGTGPFRLASWTPGTSFVLTRNEVFRGPAPDFGQVRFVIEPDPARRIDLVLRGEAEAADHVPLESIGDLQKRPDVTVVAHASLRVLFLCLRVDGPPFHDPRVREAIDLAIDRTELIRQALSGRAEPASQLVPPAVVGFNPALAPPRLDRDRARRLLAEAGHASGLKVRLDGPNNRYVNDVQIMNELARQLALVGVETKVNALDKRDFFPLIESGRSPFHFLGWSCESGEAGDVLDSLLHSPQAGTRGRLNTLGLADRELDQLIDASNASLTNKERVLRLQEALGRAADLKVVLPLVVQTEAVLLSRRVVWEPPVNMALRPETIRRAR